MIKIAMVQRNTHDAPLGLKHAHQGLHEMFFSGDISCLLKSSLKGLPRTEHWLLLRVLKHRAHWTQPDQGSMRELGQAAVDPGCVKTYLIRSTLRFFGLPAKSVVGSKDWSSRPTSALIWLLGPRQRSQQPLTDDQVA